MYNFDTYSCPLRLHTGIVTPINLCFIHMLNFFFFCSSKPRVEDNDRDELRGGPYRVEDPRAPYHPSGYL